MGPCKGCCRTDPHLHGLHACKCKPFKYLSVLLAAGALTVVSLPQFTSEVAASCFLRSAEGGQGGNRAAGQHCEEGGLHLRWAALWDLLCVSPQRVPDSIQPIQHVSTSC